MRKVRADLIKNGLISNPCRACVQGLCADTAVLEYLAETGQNYILHAGICPALKTRRQNVLKCQ